jgi:3D (Asp-Asp-Asp) domain-containing protein
LKFHSTFRRRALIYTALLTGCFILSSAYPLAAETPGQQPIKPSSTVESLSQGNLGEALSDHFAESEAVAPPISYVATAYSLRGRTASGKPVAKGLIAADPRVLPLGSRVRLEAGSYSGEYLVADTGTLVRGRRIDIWTPTSREAMRFGKRTIKLTVLSYGGKKKAQHAKR